MKIVLSFFSMFVLLFSFSIINCAQSTTTTTINPNLGQVKIKIVNQSGQTVDTGHKLYLYVYYDSAFTKTGQPNHSSNTSTDSEVLTISGITASTVYAFALYDKDGSGITVQAAATTGDPYMVYEGKSFSQTPATSIPVGTGNEYVITIGSQNTW